MNGDPDMETPTPEQAQALVDSATREHDATLAIVKVLAPLSPEKRRRIISATCILHGLPDPFHRTTR